MYPLGVVALNKKKRRVGLATKIFVAVFSIYAAFTLISLQVRINAKKSEQTALTGQAESQALRNQELQNAIDGENKDDTIAQIARDNLDYVYPGEQVFVDISSN
ncbi:MAG: septum formation initiator family protein [Clostridiaceae bacterium]|nr:septum formation initiator family protein [Clostridiaceae bacterium]